MELIMEGLAEIFDYPEGTEVHICSAVLVEALVKHGSMKPWNIADPLTRTVDV